MAFPGGPCENAAYAAYKGIIAAINPIINETTDPTKETGDFASIFSFANTLPKISFVKYASYCGTQSSGRLKKLIGLKESLRDRCIVILEDIVDSGLTMSRLLDEIKAKKPAELHVATFALKPEALNSELELDYVGFSLPNVFLVGYGLDYGGYGRNLQAIYELKS